MEDHIILGGGIAGLSLAYFLNDRSIILEKEKQSGGLCRSYSISGVSYDMGPHIMFSKNKEILDFHRSLVDCNQIKRSNKIYFDGKFIKYPFENGIGRLSKTNREYCLTSFLNNAYENYDPTNMLQFFLKTFGEGITNLYLRPYNEKIWKYDPAFMDTQMVERIPKPPKSDIIKSANGIETEGYKHQLFFYYPKQGGFQSLINAYKERIKEKSKVINSVKIKSISSQKGDWKITTNKGTLKTKNLTNCMPLHELFKYLKAPVKIQKYVNQLKYNSMLVIALHVKKDNLGKNFAVYIPNKDIIFHRISKLNFLGANYKPSGGGSVLLAEITFNSGVSLNETKAVRKVIDDLLKLKFITKKEDILEINTHFIKYAYVIYDLNHFKNTDTILSYLQNKGINSVGRFAEFRYMNSDEVAARSKRLAKKLN
ncbi:MAG: NAD(P)-binding protein [Bacteroidia bacterium]|nr:NAD(P)-binding protein [Bacteroidia bacterium]